MTLNSRPTRRSTLSALIRLASCAVLFFALPATAWTQIDERDEAQRFFYLGVKLGYEGSPPWSFELESDADPALGLDGLWLVTGNRRWGAGVSATYTRMGFHSTLNDIESRSFVESGVPFGGGSTLDFRADALGAALVLGRSGLKWVLYGGAGYALVSANISVSPDSKPSWLWMSDAEYKELIEGVANYIVRDRSPEDYATAFIYANDAVYRSHPALAAFAETFEAVEEPKPPHYDGLYFVFGVLRGNPRGINYGVTLESFGTGSAGSFFTANVTLGWKF